MSSGWERDILFLAAKNGTLGLKLWEFMRLEIWILFLVSETRACLEGFNFDPHSYTHVSDFVAIAY
jgi:hypothetical protein